MNNEPKKSLKNIFQIIINLNVKKIILFSLLVVFNLTKTVREDNNIKRKFKKLKIRYAKIKIRKRLSVNERKSIMAV